MDGAGSPLQEVAADPAADGAASTGEEPAAPAEGEAGAADETPTADDPADEATSDDDAAADDADAADGSGDDGGGFFGGLPSFSSFFSRSMKTNHRQGRQFSSTCTDRITTPCVVEDFIAAGMGTVPDCRPVHCGKSLCPNGLDTGCRIESTVAPFGIGVHFGEGADKGSPEDNFGACLRYNQMACV